MSILLFGNNPDQMDDQQIERIKALAPDIELLITEDQAEIESALSEIEIAARRFPHSLIKSAPKLRWLQQWGAGADWLLRYPDIASLENITVTNASGVHPIQITEHIFGFLLAFARQLHQAILAQSHREWRRPTREDFFDGQPFFELEGKTMLLIGVGAIGIRTAEIAQAFGMRVIGIRRNPSKTVDAVDEMAGASDLLRLLPKADFVVLTVPLTHETQGMIGEQQLRAMKPRAYIVNIGRGGTIQEDKLIQALQEEWIAGAGLDVFDTEPLPKDSPLWGLRNAIITAHYAGLTPHYEERAMDLFLDNLQRYQSGQPLRNVVDKQLGY